MTTAYKTRAWWLALALSYAHDAVGPNGACREQVAIWERQARHAMDAATAPWPDIRLTVLNPESYARQRGAFEPSFV